MRRTEGRANLFCVKQNHINFDSMSVCPSVCLSHAIYPKVAEPIVMKFGKNMWFVSPLTCTDMILCGV